MLITNVFKWYIFTFNGFANWLYLFIFQFLCILLFPVRIKVVFYCRIFSFVLSDKELSKTALADVHSGLSAHLGKKGSLVQFPVRAHTWVAGHVPSWGHMTGNHTLIFLALSFSLLSLLFKNK